MKDNLEDENKLLREKISRYERNNQIRNNLVKRIAFLFAGGDLKKSTKDLIESLYQKEFPSNEVIGNFLSALLYRFTRIGFFAILFAILPSVILSIQLYYMSEQKEIMAKQENIMNIQAEYQKSQNRYIEIQNKRIEDQTYLQEAERRSSLMFLFNSIVESIDRELRDNNIERNLSPQLIGNIISLSLRLKPYKYLENGNLISRELSPERGQLLVTLINSDLSDESLSFIINNANFEYSDLYNIDFSNLDLTGIDLSHSNIIDCKFDNSVLKNSSFHGAIVDGCSFYSANLYYSNFTVDTLNSKFDGALLNYVFINADQWAIEEETYGLLGLKQIIGNYEIDTFETETPFFRLKEKSGYEKFNLCEKVVLDIIRSSKYTESVSRSLREPAKLTFILDSSREVSDSTFINLENYEWSFNMHGNSDYNRIMSRIGSVTFDGKQKQLYREDVASGTNIKIDFDEKLVRKYVEVCIN